MMEIGRFPSWNFKMEGTNIVSVNKRKIINDPVLGFVQIPDPIVFDLISHPYIQRLRHITQMGMSFMVYPGAVHTRFNHTLGCLHLMQQALQVLADKGADISDHEKLSACVAILLHDVGHGPFSHVLERSIVSGVNHEQLTLLFMEVLDREFHGQLSDAISIFRDTYPKKYLHQLVSGQIDVDRLDYLNRDSFHSGVLEGTVGTDRIIKMLRVNDDQLVVEEKGLYSLEKFVLSRRLMFWQVYLHKTSVCAEQMLISALQRVRFLLDKGKNVGGGEDLLFFLGNVCTLDDFKKDPGLLPRFASLDDHDIWSALKVWARHSDKVLSFLSTSILNRNLFRTELSDVPFQQEHVSGRRNEVARQLGLAEAEVGYLVLEKELTPKTYNPRKEGIHILGKDGRVRDITKVSELLDSHFVKKQDVKYLLCYPRI